MFASNSAVIALKRTSCIAEGDLPGSRAKVPRMALDTITLAGLTKPLVWEFEQGKLRMHPTRDRSGNVDDATHELAKNLGKSQPLFFVRTDVLEKESLTQFPVF